MPDSKKTCQDQGIVIMNRFSAETLRGETKRILVLTNMLDLRPANKFQVDQCERLLLIQVPAA